MKVERKQYVVVLYFSLFYLLFYFISIPFYSTLWSDFNPHFLSFILAISSTYFVFLGIHGLNILDSFRGSEKREIINDIKSVKNNIAEVNRRMGEIEKYMAEEHKKNEKTKTMMKRTKK